MRAKHFLREIDNIFQREADHDVALKNRIEHQTELDVLGVELDFVELISFIIIENIIPKMEYVERITLVEGLINSTTFEKVYSGLFILSNSTHFPEIHNTFQEDNWKTGSIDGLKNLFSSRNKAYLDTQKGHDKIDLIKSVNYDIASDRGEMSKN